MKKFIELKDGDILNTWEFGHYDSHTILSVENMGNLLIIDLEHDTVFVDCEDFEKSTVIERDFHRWIAYGTDMDELKNKTESLDCLR